MGRYVQLLIQEMSIKLDVGYLLSLLAVFKYQQRLIYPRRDGQAELAGVG